MAWDAAHPMTLPHAACRASTYSVNTQNSSRKMAVQRWNVYVIGKGRLGPLTRGNDLGRIIK